MWGGNQSIFNPSFVDTVDFYSGGFPSKCPQALSGVIDVKNIEVIMKKTNGFAEMSAASLEGFIQATNGNPINHLMYLVSDEPIMI